jgi:poly(A) polymerase/tRNA nucleotidyltransferase (CCA-adding enzyme)
MTEQVLRRLKFDNETREKVTHLVRRHMFYYDVGKVTEAGARRLLRRVGKEHFDDLIKLRIAERKGSGVPKAEPYRLRHLQFLVEKAAQEPITTSQLAINGNDLIAKLGMKPGPKIGGVLNALLAQVLDDAKNNKQDWLLEQAKILMEKDPTELKALGEVAKDEAERKREDDIKRKYHV